jgi:hypothetical protein
VIKNETTWLFGEEFLSDYAGRNILKDPIRAIMELIVNSWDAGATRVDISWPSLNSDTLIIKDNGSGMSESDLERIWKTWKYDRIKEFGHYSLWPENVSDEIKKKKRKVFGKNGKGRFAAFCFGSLVEISSWKNGKGSSFKVELASTKEKPFEIEKIGGIKEEGSGTIIEIKNALSYNKSQDEIMAEIGMRLLTDPTFEAYVNEEKVTFESIPEKNIETVPIDVESVGEVIIKIIDTEKADTTTRHHGIAWHVNRRLVGEANWRGIEYFIDGRKRRSKRYTFIVEADVLSDKNAVLFDWSGFDEKNESYIKVKKEVSEFIINFLNQTSDESRKAKIDELKEKQKTEYTSLSRVSQQKWNQILDEIQKECPSVRDNDIDKISELMINLEKSNSKYALLHFLSEQPPKNLDDLNEILQKWGVVATKEVLDEIERRILLINELEDKIRYKETDELHDLQPIFEKGLWMFGAEYESIEFQSNKQMRTVLREFFKVGDGTANRPDFVILPDGSGSIDGYCRPAYDDNGDVCGIEKIVIVELKKPKIIIGSDQKNQADKYAKEFVRKGVTGFTKKIQCYVLGSEVDPVELKPRKEDIIEICAMSYDTLLQRARKRLLNLEKSVKEAPFYKEDVSQRNLF